MSLCYCRYAILGVHSGPEELVQIEDPPVIFEDKDENNNNRIHDIMLLKLPSRFKHFQTVGLPDCEKRPKMWVLRLQMKTCFQIFLIVVLFMC